MLINELSHIISFMKPLDALKKAIDIAGTQEELAKRIKYDQSSISLWKTAKRVPAEAAPLIEKAVAGAVTRAQLRPDLFSQE